MFLSYMFYLSATRDSDCHTVDQQTCNSFRRKTGSFVASGYGSRPAVARRSPNPNPKPKTRAPDRPERVAVPGRAHFQGEDVRKMRIRGWGHEIKETKRLPVYVSCMRKSTKTTLFRLIRLKTGSCPEIARFVRAKTMTPPACRVLAGETPATTPVGDCRIAIPAYIKTFRRAAGDPQGKRDVYNSEIWFF